MVEEYRRFLVLTQVAGRPVSPSADVDEAWHLHLTRTGHYERLCRELFGRFLHHEAARAGEGAKHRDMYRATLAAYREAFGFSAPAVVWPRPDQPAVPQPPPELTWTVPPSLRDGRRLGMVAMLAAVISGVWLQGLGLLQPLQAVGPFAFLGAALLAMAGLAWWGLRSGLPPAAATARDRFEPYEAAWFSGGAERMAMTAIVALTERSVLLAPGRPSERGARPPIPVDRSVEPRCEHPAEAVCLAAATDAGLRFSDACRAMRPMAAAVEARLVAAGIIDDTAALPLRRARALVLLVVLLAVEVERIVHTHRSSHPVGFLVLLTLAGFAAAFALARPLRRASARSERVLRPLRMSAGLSGTAPRTKQALAFGVALIGGTALADDLRFDGLEQQVNINVSGTDPALRRRGARDDDSDCSSGSCGSSCSGGDGASGGGSSCGSSCGGGGGCGGGGD